MQPEGDRSVVGIQRGEIRGEGVHSSNSDRFGQLRRQEHLPTAAQRPGRLEVRAGLVDQGV